MRIFEALVAVNPDWPAEARFKLAGSDTLVRVHLRGLRPPVKTTRLDWPVSPCLGEPYLKKRSRFFMAYVRMQCTTHAPITTVNMDIFAL